MAATRGLQAFWKELRRVMYKITQKFWKKVWCSSVSRQWLHALPTELHTSGQPVRRANLSRQSVAGDTTLLEPRPHGVCTT